MIDAELSNALYRDATQPVTRRVADLLSRMTLAEKVGQMLQLNGQVDPVKAVQEMQPGSFLHLLDERLADAMDAAAATRLGIPLLVGEDGIHGHSFHPGATIFPTQLALAASWDAELIERVARVTAKEMATTGAHWTFSPVLCLTRDQRWGRTGETFGEDPFLIAELGAAMIRGYQGKGLSDPDGVLATAKHYAGYSETQGGRDASEADISRRKLKSFFLPPFERAVRAGCMTFMTGYQSIDGLPSTANHWLLRQVLKHDWGFEGILVTDYDNVARLVYEQRVAPSLVEAAVIAVRCGNDMIMVTPGFYAAAQEAVQRGLLQEAEIDEVVRRILTLKFRMGLFENQRRPDRAAQARVVNCAEHRELNLRAARESLVLLSNDGTLPLDPSQLTRVAVVGPNADNPLAQLGDWSLGATQYDSKYGQHPRELTVTVLDGLRARLPGAHISHASAGDLWSKDPAALEAALGLVHESELAVVVVGDDIPFIGETRSTATLELLGNQNALIDGVAASGKPFVLVLVASKPLVLPESAKRAAAIIECFNPGMQGGTALVEALFGDLNPAGKLTISYPRHVGQQPIFYSQVRGQHGNRYADLTQEPLFPFGHGLSYTHFTYKKLLVKTPVVHEGQDVELEVELTNDGGRAGTEIVQVYVSDLVTSVTWVNQSLVAFERVTLEPGAKRTLRLLVPYERLSLVNAYEDRVVEPGEFVLMVGGSSDRRSCLTASFKVDGCAFSFENIPGVSR
ncbi:MAG TPA: glycoside hydrolase family 3 N-terminal domain-containing protein [Polyangiaceae bacterium]|nr:glycoside hydrolase family 3 N-terminal domain-containing protein [Polyangiaceae bacterium]